MAITSFHHESIPRIALLINKISQFNLTNRRYSETQIKQLATDPNHLCLQISLMDNFGGHGIISIVIAKPLAYQNKTLHIDTWIMSGCVLGRQVEQEVLNGLVEQARMRGYTALQGEYISSPKNQIVRNHYHQLGFSLLKEQLMKNGTVQGYWELNLLHFKNLDTLITRDPAEPKSKTVPAQTLF